MTAPFTNICTVCPWWRRSRWSPTRQRASQSALATRSYVIFAVSEIAKEILHPVQIRAAPQPSWRENTHSGTQQTYRWAPRSRNRLDRPDRSARAFGLASEHSAPDLLCRSLSYTYIRIFSRVLGSSDSHGRHPFNARLFRRPWRDATCWHVPKQEVARPQHFSFQSCIGL